MRNFCFRRHIKSAVHHKRHIADSFAHALAVRITAVTGIKEQYIQFLLAHGKAQASEIHFCPRIFAGHGFHKFMFAAGLAAVHGQNAAAFANHIAGNALHENNSAHSGDTIGITANRSSEPHNGAVTFANNFRKFDHLILRHAGDCLHLFQTIALHIFFQHIQFRHQFTGFFFVQEFVLHQIIDNAHGQHAVRAGNGMNLKINEIAGAGAARVYIHNLYIFLFCHHEPARIGRIEFAKVGAP